MSEKTRLYRIHCTLPIGLQLDRRRRLAGLGLERRRLPPARGIPEKET